MTTNDPRREPRETGYRGALSPRQDRLAAWWIAIVVAVFVLIIVLSMLGIPSRFIPEETPLPLPSASASADASASAESSAGESASAEASTEESAEASAGESASAEASADE